MAQEGFDQELTALEAALGSLTPQKSSLDRERLMYLAGQASVAAAVRSPRRWLWPSAAAVMTLASATLAVLLALRPEPQTRERIVYVPVEQPAQPPKAPSPLTAEPNSPAPPAAVNSELARVPRLPIPQASANALRLRNYALAYGIDSIPPAPGHGHSNDGRAPQSRRELEQLLLDSGAELTPRWPRFRLNPRSIDGESS